MKSTKRKAMHQGAEIRGRATSFIPGVVLSPNNIIEKWKPFRHGTYEVSNLGDVRRLLPARNTFKGRRLKQNNIKGYRQVQTMVDGVRKCYYVHCLVARKFIGPCPEGMEVNHKDLNKANNHVDNLEYMTDLDNKLHARKNGVRIYGATGEKNPGAKLTHKIVHEIRKLYRKGKYNQYELAAKFKVTQPMISLVVNHKFWNS